jgi:hypothetical protein
MTTSIENFHLRDFQDLDSGKAVKSPSVHIARGYELYIPHILHCGRPIVCISDWQCETSTQRYFWAQACTLLKEKIGRDVLERSLVIVACDMASKNNSLRGSKSDAAPDFSWLRESFPDSTAEILIVYGNHDFISPDHLQLRNTVTGLPCLLPQGGWVNIPAEGQRYNNFPNEDAISSILEATHIPSDQMHNSYASRTVHIPEFLQDMTKEERRAYHAKQPRVKKPAASQKEARQRSLQWDKNHPEQAHLAACFQKTQSLIQASVGEQESNILSSDAPPPFLRVGAVHGIPAAFTEGTKKIEREEYFRALEAVCAETSPIDILVTHCNPCLPGQENVVMGEDPKRMYEAFHQSRAYIHVCGHMHMDSPVSIVAENKVVVNADCRVVAFVPSSS